MSSRWVVVDDTSSNINYFGDWFADVGSQDAEGAERGPPFLSTLRGTNKSASLAFNFTGRWHMNFNPLPNKNDNS